LDNLAVQHGIWHTHFNLKAWQVGRPAIGTCVFGWALWTVRTTIRIGADPFSSATRTAGYQAVVSGAALTVCVGFTNIAKVVRPTIRWREVVSTVYLLVTDTLIRQILIAIGAAIIVIDRATKQKKHAYDV
jgi:hypothetical protein